MDFLRRTKEKALDLGTRIFETDMRYVLPGTFWITLAQVIASFLSFLLAIAFAYFMSKEDYGNYKYILSVAGLLSAFSLSGLSTAIVQSVARGYESTFKHSFAISLKWSMGAILIGLGIAGYYFYTGNNLLALCMLVASFGAPVINSALLYRSFLNGRKLFRSTAAANIMMNVIPALTIFIALIATKSPIYTVLAYFISNSLVGLAIHRYMFNKYKPNDENDPAALPYAKHLSAINILDLIATNLDKVMLFQFLGATSLSIYSFAIAIPEQVRNLFRAIPTLAVPKLAGKTNEEIHKVIYKKIFKLFLITIPAIVAYYFAAPLIYSLVFPQYMESVPYSQLFIVILLVEGGLAGSVLEAKRAIKEQYILNVIGNIVKIGLLFVFLALYGIWGIIIARILSRVFGFSLSLALLKKLK